MFALKVPFMSAGKKKKKINKSFYISFSVRGLQLLESWIITYENMVMKK